MSALVSCCWPQTACCNNAPTGVTDSRHNSYKTLGLLSSAYCQHAASGTVLSTIMVPMMNRS
jgi:hypothetical protein